MASDLFYPRQMPLPVPAKPAGLSLDRVCPECGRRYRAELDGSRFCRPKCKNRHLALKIRKSGDESA